MLDMLRKRQENEEGFTLIELMVVVLIIAILLAIAIPTFLGARERAQDRAAQSNLRNGLTAEKVYYTDAQAYTNDDASAAGLIKAIEPSLTYGLPGGALAASTVNISASTNGSTADQVVMLGTKSASGKCYYLKDVATVGSTVTLAGTFYGGGNTTCAAANAATATAAKW